MVIIVVAGFLSYYRISRGKRTAEYKNHLQLRSISYVHLFFSSKINWFSHAFASPINPAWCKLSNDVRHSILLRKWALLLKKYPQILLTLVLRLLTSTRAIAVVLAINIEYVVGLLRRALLSVLPLLLWWLMGWKNKPLWRLRSKEAVALGLGRGTW